MKRIEIILCFLILMSEHCFSSINFRTGLSTLKISSGAGLILEKAIPCCAGKISKSDGAIITGQDINFNEGSFDDGTTSMNMSAIFRPNTNQIVLNGGKSLRGNGGFIHQSLVISGTNNKLDGEILIDEDLVLQDANTQLICGFMRRFPQDIVLNGGTISLEEDLDFLEEKRLKGPGTFRCDGRTMWLACEKDEPWETSLYYDEASDIGLKDSLQLAQTWTFSGSHCLIIGNGNTLELSKYGNLVVERGSKLILRDLVVKNIAGNQIRCLDDAGSIVFDNVSLLPANDVSMDKGFFEVEGYLNFYGKKTLTYQSNMLLTVNHNAFIYMDAGSTFSYAPLSACNNNIRFEDTSSTLWLDGATLFATSTGLQLTKGTLVVRRPSRLVTHGTIIVGNNVESDDFTCQILGGSKLSVTSGVFAYKNVGLLSFDMENNLSTLEIFPGCSLNMYQTLRLGSGQLITYANTCLGFAAGKNIVGTMNPSGHLIYGNL